MRWCRIFQIRRHSRWVIAPIGLGMAEPWDDAAIYDDYLHMHSRAPFASPAVSIGADSNG
jgi:hypothetical protein